MKIYLQISTKNAILISYYDFKEVFYLTKIEVEQLQKLIQKLEKQAVFDIINEHMFSEGACSVKILTVFTAQ